MNYEHPKTPIEKQQNTLSQNLLKVHKKNRNFAVLILPLLTFVLSVIFYIAIIYPIRPTQGLLIFILPFFIALLGWSGWKWAERDIAEKIYYYQEGIQVVRRSGNKIFLQWNDILDVRPLKAYGKIKVPDYMLFFKKPFPGYTPVSAEVAEKIREYMDKYKNQEGESENLKIEGGDR